MTDLTPRSLFVRRDRVVANDLSETETVMLDVDEGTYFGVTGVGRAIWDLLAETTTVDSIVQELLARYDIDEATCRSEVDSFVSDLADQGLVDVGTPPAAS